MKKLVALLIVLVLGSSAAFAQGSETATSSSPIVVAIATQMSGYFYSNMWGSNNVDANLRSLLNGYNTVVWKPTGEFAVDSSVVASYSVVDDRQGNRTYTFDLVHGLLYNNGTPITAKDYVFTVLLQSDPLISELGGQPTNFENLTGYSEYVAGTHAIFSGVRLLGDYRFSITVSSDRLPYYFEQMLMDINPTPIQAIAPGYDVRDDGRGVYLTNATAEVGAPVPLTLDLLKTTLIGENGYVHQPHITSGPYQLVTYDAAASSATIAINPYYQGNFEGRKPELPAIKIVYMDNESALDAYERGNVQIIHKMTDVSEVARARTLQESGGGELINFLSAGYSFLAFACEQAPTDDVNVRKAIAMCIDRNAFCTDLFQNNALPVYAYYGYGQWIVSQNTDALAKYEIGFDVDTARDLLIKAGYTYNEDGKQYKDNKHQVRCCIKKGKLIPLELRWAKTPGKASDLLESQLTDACAKLGIRLKVKNMSFADMLPQYLRVNETRDYNLFFLTETFFFTFDPYNTYNVDDAWQGAVNTSGLRDERLMRAARDMRRVPSGDIEAFTAKWFKFQDRWREVMPTAPIYSNVYFDLCSPTLYEYTANVRYGLSYALLNTTLVKPTGTP